MVNSTNLSWVLGVLSVIGIWLAGKHDWRGWAFVLFTEPVWGWYAVISRSWGLFVATFAYSAVAAWNIVKWRRERG